MSPSEVQRVQVDPSEFKWIQVSLSDALFPAPRSSESQRCMSVSCICIWLNTRKTVSTSLVLGPGNHFAIASSSFFHYSLSLQWMQKGCKYSCTYSQGWLQELLVSRKCSNWYYMFHEFWCHGLSVSGQGLNVYTKCVIPTFRIFEMSWIHKHLSSLKRRVLRTPPHLCPYIHECTKLM